MGQNLQREQKLGGKLQKETDEKNRQAMSCGGTHGYEATANLHATTTMAETPADSLAASGNLFNGSLDGGVQRSGIGFTLDQEVGRPQ